MSPLVINGLLMVGVMTMLYTFLTLLTKFLHVFQLYTGSADVRKYGTWAIVTGSTDGIGKAIAKELARQKINLILISRSADKLAAVAAEMGDVKVETEAIDMSKTDQGTYDDLARKYGHLDVGIVVNNVGLSYDHPDYLDASDSDRLWNIIKMNTIPCTMLTKAFLPGMTQKKRGLVVNVGSQSGLFNTPLLSVYSASKAYVHTLTESLRQEYAEKRIDFQVICPMFVATAMTGMRKSTMCPDPATYARSAVASFGKFDFTCGYWAHAAQTALYSLAPKMYFDANQLKVMKKGRARWYKKQGEKKE